MKENLKKEFEGIVINAIEKYFQESGINQILLKLYKHTMSQKLNTSTVQKTQVPKIKNIIDNNTKTMSKLQQLKQKSLQNEDKILFDENLQSPQMNIQQKVSPNIRVTVNENIDPLKTGKSILDDVDSLPTFLKKGLGKLQRNAKS